MLYGQLVEVAQAAARSDADVKLDKHGRPIDDEELELGENVLIVNTEEQEHEALLALVRRSGSTCRRGITEQRKWQRRKTATARRWFATATPPRSSLSQRDRQTHAGAVKERWPMASCKTAERKRDPYLDIPSRTLSNVRFNKSRKIIEMGSNKNRRLLFDLSQAKAYMRTMLVANKVKSLIDDGKTASLRSMFYMVKHTIAGTKEETFDKQSESDPIIEDLEVTLDSLREELHLYAKKAGDLVGPISIVDNGDEIDCTRMGSGGYGIPSIVEPEQRTIQRVRRQVRLACRKGCRLATLQRRSLLANSQLHFDPRRRATTPWRAATIKPAAQRVEAADLLRPGQRSVGVLHLQRDQARFDQPGLRIQTHGQCPKRSSSVCAALTWSATILPDSAKISLNDKDRQRAKQIAEYPWFEHKKAWQKEINKMLANGFKLEVEAMATRDISFVTETYVPERLENPKDWLD